MFNYKIVYNIFVISHLRKFCTGQEYFSSDDYVFPFLTSDYLNGSRTLIQHYDPHWIRDDVGNHFQSTFLYIEDTGIGIYYNPIIVNRMPIILCSNVLNFSS